MVLEYPENRRPEAEEIGRLLAGDETFPTLDMQIAASTGYFTEAMEAVNAVASAQGYNPDFRICATQVPAGRPAPWMIYRAMEALNVYPPQAVVAIGDTRPDVEAGLNAGAWTIALAKTGTEMGLTEAEIAALPEPELHTRLSRRRRAGRGKRL